MEVVQVQSVNSSLHCSRFGQSPEFLRVHNALWLSTANVWFWFFLLYNIQPFYICFFCEDLKRITVNFITETLKSTVLQHFNP